MLDPRRVFLRTRRAGHGLLRRPPPPFEATQVELGYEGTTASRAVRVEPGTAPPGGISADSLGNVKKKHIAYFVVQRRRLALVAPRDPPPYTRFTRS